MKKLLILTALLIIASFGFASTAMADSFTGQGNIIWTWTNEGSDGGTGFLVQLTVDASNPGPGNSMFDVLAIQLSSGTTNGVITSDPVTTNTTGWTFQGTGNVNHCGSGNPPFYCFSTTSPITISPTNTGVYTFLFDVTGLSSPPDTGDVQALQGSLPGSDGSYAISHSFGVSPFTSAPEPASLTLLGLGLLGVPFLRRKRA